MTDRMEYVKIKNKHRKDHTSCSSYSSSVTASEVKDKQTNSHCNILVENMDSAVIIGGETTFSLRYGQR